MQVELIPSLLAADQPTFLNQVYGLEDSIALIQIDIADGRFVSTTTWADPEVIKNELQMQCELHLMAQDPFSIMKQWASAHQVTRVLVHFESKFNFDQILPFCQSHGWKIGLVLNPQTSIDVIETYTSALERVMLMGVQPGSQGQAFIPETLDRIRACKARYQGLRVAVDGAVNENTLPGIIAAGADAVCPGSAIFGNQQAPAENVRRLQKQIERLTDNR